MAYNGLPHDIYLTDVSLLTPAVDEETIKFFETLEIEKVKIVNISRDFLFGEKAEKIIEDFINKGGIIVKASGNAGRSWPEWNTEGIKLGKGKDSLFDDYSSKIALHDIHLHKWLGKNPSLRRGFIFAEFTSDKYKAFVNRAGNNTPERFISVEESVYSRVTLSGYLVNGEGSSTSAAAATITGIIGALQEEYPWFTPQEIAQALLDTADPLPDSKGQGRVNAQAAYIALQDKKKS